MTVADLEQPNAILQKKIILQSPAEKIEWR